MPSRNAPEDESDMNDMYEGAENNFNTNDIGNQRLEIKNNIIATHKTSKFMDDYRSDENVNHANNQRDEMNIDEPSFDGEIIAVGG